ncbi:MAG: hypothetical protein ACE5EO_01255 [Candidatus Krumholzibacteriia bacterium]
MSGGTVTRLAVAAPILVVGAAIALLEGMGGRPGDGSLLMTLTFWTMLVQGCVALAAIGEVAKGLWLIPIKRDLYATYPLLLLLALLYLVMGTRMEIYAWTGHPTAWLNVQFFIIRNVALMLLLFWVARLLAQAAMKGSPAKNTYAVVYLALWVTSQSLIAFDWIMSLEYPWISTLFGGYFFVQSLLMGLIVSVYIIFFRTRRGANHLKETLRDCGKMILSFCFMWGGFFFAQYLVIWYGNIPEEVAYVLKRVDSAPYWGLSRAVLLMMFVIPFGALLSRALKTHRLGMVTVSSIVLAGMALHLLVLIRPVVPIELPRVAVASALMAALLAFLIWRRDSFIPQQVTGEAVGGAGEAAGDLASAHDR